MDMLNCVVRVIVHFFIKQCFSSNTFYAYVYTRVCVRKFYLLVRKPIVGTKVRSTNGEPVGKFSYLESEAPTKKFIHILLKST